MNAEDAAPTPANVGPGAKIAGYRLEEQIGQGGMAVVYRAFDERLERRVALKLLAPTLTADAAFRTRFIRESRAAAAVDHPNIIPVYDAGDAGGFLFISMRYVQGGDVRALLSSGPLEPERAWNILTQVASALDAAHAHHLVHRDVKPGNILLDARRDATSGDQRDHVYLSDFGISRQTVASHVTSTGQFVGTLDYIAPEQIEAQEVDGRADQYSLACAAFELLGGGPPFQKSQALGLISAHLAERPPSLTARRRGLPRAIDQVLAKAMAKSPEDRYDTCGDFTADLGRALGLMPGLPAAQMSADGSAPATKLATPAASAGPAAAAALDATISTTPAEAAVAATLDPRQPAGPVPTRPPRQGTAPYPPQQQYPQAPVAGRSRGLLVGILVGVVVAAAGVGIAFALSHKGNGAPGPNGNSSLGSHSPGQGTARTQAMALNNLLITSLNNRPAWDNLVNDVTNCTNTNIGFDVSQIQKIAANHKTELSSATGLQLSALPNGAAMKSDLVKALQVSLTIDNDYLRWARQQQSTSCSIGTNSGDYRAASNGNSQATAAKDEFLSLWNPIARGYGFSVLTAGQL